MKVVLFYHSVVSDWNHGNAHFLRGRCTELVKAGHRVNVYEPVNGRSYRNLIVEGGKKALNDSHALYPGISATFYDINTIYITEVLKDADLVMVHEWNDPQLVEKIGIHHKNHSHYSLLFHDTHHRSVSDPAAMKKYDLSGYDGVLAYGKVIKDLYLKNGWTDKAWVWHEAADANIFYPKKYREKEGDLVWAGNWGDEERSDELMEFLIKPTIRPFVAMAYGIPLICFLKFTMN